MDLAYRLGRRLGGTNAGRTSCFGAVVPRCWGLLVQTGVVCELERSREGCAAVGGAGELTGGGIEADVDEICGIDPLAP